MHESNGPRISGVEASRLVLCVDDEPNVLAALRRLLRRHGYEVLLAGSGAEGLQILESQPVGVVISDMRMPGMDGAVFLKQVHERWPGTIRILLTGYASPDTLAAAINEAKVYRCLDKPWVDEDLAKMVGEALSSTTSRTA